MGTVRPFFELFAESLDGNRLGLRCVFHYLAQRLVISGNRIHFGGHRFPAFFEMISTMRSSTIGTLTGTPLLGTGPSGENP